MSEPPNRAKELISPTVAALLSLGFLVAIGPRLNAKLQPSSAATAPSVKLPAPVLRALTFGFQNVLADYEWLNAIQYYGMKENAEERFCRLYDIVDTVTDLDPRFEYASQFGAESIPYHDPNGEWYHTRQAIAFGKKAFDHSPTRWEIPWAVGFDLFDYWGEYQEAGKAMMLAADLGESLGRSARDRGTAPTYLRSLAVRLLAQGGDVDTAILSPQTSLAAAIAPERRAELQEHLDSLLLQQQLDQLNAAAKVLRDSAVREPTLEQLSAQANLGGLTVDPYGERYFLDTLGKVHSTNESKLLKLHFHPGLPPIEHAVD